jgi:hypothetical protein
MAENYASLIPGFVRVNIHNQGTIPWLGLNGPLYNYDISQSLFDILRNTPGVLIKTVDQENKEQAEKAEAARKAAEEAKRKAEIEKEATEEANAIMEKTASDGLSVSDDVKVAQAVADSDPDKDFFEKVEDQINALPDQKSEIAEKVVAPTEGFKKYTEHDMDKMTTDQMRKILNEERGFSDPDSPYHGRYHDTIDGLKKKIRASQK